MSSTKNVKILTLLQLCTVIAVVLTAWFYVRPLHLASAASCGMIDGILFSPDDPSVLIDGQVLKIGDQIYGVRVIGIDRSMVTFERNSKRWEQRIRQRPNIAWDEPDMPESDTTNTPDQTALANKPAPSKQATPQSNASPTSAQPVP